MIERSTTTTTIGGDRPSPGRNGRSGSQRLEFTYLAHSPDQEITQGVIKAGSLTEAEEILVRAGFRPLVIRRAKKSIWQRELFKSRKVKAQHLLTFTEQMAVLLRAGVPLVTTLEALHHQAEQAAFKESLETIAEDVRGGAPLSEAMGKYPDIFSSFYRQMILLGERSGDIEGILEQTTAYLTREQNLRKTIRRAMFYPILVLGLAIVVTVVMVQFVLPNILELFVALNVPLPLITRVVLGTSAFINENKLYLGGGVVMGLVALLMAYRRPGTRDLMDRLLLRLPIIKRMIVYRELGRFARLTALMLHNALPLSNILGMVAGATSNREVRQVFLNAQASVTGGHNLSGGLGEAPFMPPMFTNLVRIGEISGSLEGNLNTIADFYDRELDALIESTLQLLEPILTIVVGLVIALVALTIIVPIYSLIGSAG